MASASSDAEMAKRRSEVVEWLNGLFSDFKLSPNASEEELRARLIDGAVLCAILRRLFPRYVEEARGVDNVKKFLSAIERMGLHGFKSSDLEQGPISAVVICLLSLRDRSSSHVGEDRFPNSSAKGESEAMRRWKLLENSRLEAVDVLRMENSRGAQNGEGLGEERKQSMMESKLQRVLRSPVMSEPSTPLSRYAGHKFHEVFQLKQGGYSDLPAAKISEMMKSNSLDNAPTQSLLSVVNGILDESIERKSGEIPYRVACLLRKVIQEIERRISTQAEHIRNQNNLIKAREEKYQSRIRVLETLASGTSEQTQTETNKVDEKKRVGEEEMTRLIKEKGNSDLIISNLKKELESLKTGEEQVTRLMKEKEDCDLIISNLKKELEALKTGEEQISRWMKEKGDCDLIISNLKKELEALKTGEEHVTRLMKEKGDSDLIISNLKKELEALKTREERVTRLMKGKGDSDLIISKLKQELETSKNGEEQVTRLTKEKKDSDLIISKLKQELETLKNGEEQVTRLMKGKEECDLIILKLKQELENLKKSYEEQGQLLETKKEDVIRLSKEKENSDNIISKLKREIEVAKKLHEQQCQQLEIKAKETKVELEKRIKEVEHLLEESRRRTKELELSSESKFKKYIEKESLVRKFTGVQLQNVQELRLSSVSIRHEVLNTQNRWSEEINNLGQRLKVMIDAAQNYHATLAENRKLYNEIQELKGNIRVYCRIRPFLPGENRKSTTIEYIGQNGEILLANPSKQGKDGHKMFTFNKVFGPVVTQEEVFVDIQPLIRSVLDGYNVCIFAYGQTGSGKTYTMTGPNNLTEKEWGVNYRALNDLFHISRNRGDTIMYEVGVQMVEIYNEQVRDLLINDGSQKKLGILNISQPDGLAVPDASMHPVKSTSDVIELMQRGFANRAVGATALNDRSSRSHSIVTVHVRGLDLKTGATLRGSLHLVDLAGSERVDRSEVTGDRLKEAQHINKSLSALGDVIFALSQKNAHVPYRNSKLTQVLQSSLGGHAKTLMFVQINPDASSYSESLSTLKFAERVSGVELGVARSQKEGKDVRELMEQVSFLKDTIAKKDEEIEHLQLLKDVKTHSPRLKVEKHGAALLKHSSSSPGVSLLSGSTAPQNQKSSIGRTVTNNRAAPDTDVFSDNSDRHSEAGSLQSIDDFKHQKEIVIGQSKLSGGETGQSSIELDFVSLGDADYEERLSDISDSGLSMGTETDGSISSVVEFTLFPESEQSSDATREKAGKAPTRIPRPSSSQKLQTTSLRAKPKEALKSPSLRRSTTTQAAVSSPRTPKRWQ
ncbi:kinesin-like protein KIN-14D isoform X2 [Ananas comosus]|uniref:Kinesin-like protein KIN-14D isoform X2 n=1 Tax=Ananas comosus TaxID=4615 RepID=A0A6P5F8A9_ANACO|nr:kinesin-like protein KIN-14D isoform X2 [Ananas comosus]